MRQPNIDSKKCYLEHFMNTTLHENLALKSCLQWKKLHTGNLCKHKVVSEKPFCNREQAKKHFHSRIRQLAGQTWSLHTPNQFIAEFVDLIVPERYLDTKLQGRRELSSMENKLRIQESNQWCWACNKVQEGVQQSRARGEEWVVVVQENQKMGEDGYLEQCLFAGTWS